MKRPLIVFPMVYEARSTFNFFNEPLKCVRINKDNDS